MQVLASNQISLPVDMYALSEQEVEQISGGWGPAGAVGGAFVGASTYIGQAAFSGSGSWGGLAGAIGAGAVGGFLFGPASMAGTIAGSFGGFYAGGAGGLIERSLM
jgi:lactobin A/cerein 7B family class IIb bacteriocin